jgi:HEPN domain-containing protein
MKRKYKLPEEWLSQADYDLKTARSMFRSRRYIYSIFFCHLTIEKALKGVYAFKLEKDPPKTHNLNYLCEQMELSVPENFQDFIDNLNNLSVPTRYPDQLQKLLKDFKKDLTRKMFRQTKEVLEWLKKKII